MANWTLANVTQTNPNAQSPFKGMTWHFLRNGTPVASITAQVNINDETVHFIINTLPILPEFSITTTLDRTFSP